MISIHYINTSYHVQNTVMRVHVFNRDEISEKSYLGCFTLRKIDEARIMLSYIYPNWANLVCGGAQLYVMTYPKEVHICGRKLKFYTYPLLVQDNITITCAQASIISMTRYLHKRYDYNRARIIDINNAFSYGKTKMFPATGLLATQMIEIFNYYDVPIGYEVLNSESEEDYKKFREYIDYSIESGLLVLLALGIREENVLKRHIIQIIGHPARGRESYVIYDDSGCLLKNMGLSGFVKVIRWERLKTYIREQSGFLMYPIHEKVYILYDDLKNIFMHYFNGIPELVELSSSGDALVDQARYLLVDNRELKAYLLNCVIPDETLEKEAREEAEYLTEISMPHFVWYCEIPLKDNSYLVFAGDPTYGKMTSHMIFYNRVAIRVHAQLGILKYEQHL